MNKVFGTVTASQDCALDSSIKNFCSSLLSSFRRYDQRERAEMYIRGLLTVNGRKTARNIGSRLGIPGADQSLNHFVVSSTWDWWRIRQDLARYVSHVVNPLAWVIQPTIIPKTGDRSVGVRRAYAPSYERMLSHQLAFGVWFANESIGSPVNWRLALPPGWLSAEARKIAGIPDYIHETTPTQCAAEMILEMIRAYDCSLQPIVMDARNADSARLMSTFAKQKIPFLLRVDNNTSLTSADSAVRRHSIGPMRASSIAKFVKGFRRRVQYWDSYNQNVDSILALNTQVQPQGSNLDTINEYSAHTLIAQWRWENKKEPATWLTNLTRPLEEKVRLSALTRDAKLSLAERSTELGIRDFEGRSFQGWHRHSTLVSVAQAIMELSSLAEDM